MEHITPETQQFVIHILWWIVGSMAAVIVFFGGIIGLGGKYFASKALTRIDKLEEAGIKIGNDMVLGLNGVREALTSHHNDLSGRIERTNTNVALHKQTLDAVKERTDKEIPDLFKRVIKVENEHKETRFYLSKVVKMPEGE